MGGLLRRGKLVPVRAFVSYRREDSSASAGRLRDALAARFGHDRVFQDVVAISPGESFDNAIETALEQCDVTLAVIGPRWLETTGSDGEPRLSDPDDYVRRELIAALEHGHQVIPVLVGGATMPASTALPSELRALAQRQAVSLRDETWHADVDRLVEALVGAAPTKRGSGRLVAVAALVVAVVATVVIVLVASRDPPADTSDSPQNTGTAASATTFNAAFATLPTCPTPRPPEWTDLELRGETAPRPDAQWTFEVVGAGYRQAAGESWDVVIRTVATNQHPDESVTHYPFYSLVVDGEESGPPSCFEVVAGERMLSPLGSSEALVGFHVSAEPTAAVALDIDSSGERYRVELVPTTE